MLGFESGMAGDTGRSRGCMLLLLIMACISLTVSDGPTCPMEMLENTSVDIKPAVTKGARGNDPVFMDTEESCVEKCCSSKTTSGALNCSLVIFDSRKTGKHPNCYLFHCPTDEACPTKPTTGVTSYLVIRDNGQAEKSSSKSKDTIPTYVNVNEEKSMSLNSEPSDAQNTKERVSEDSNMIKSITSKMLDMTENIEKQLDNMDHSLEKEQEKPEEKKKIENPSSDRKPSETAENVAPQPIGSHDFEPEVSIKIITTTQATTSTTTLAPTTTLHTTTSLITTTPLPTTTPLITTPTTTSLTTTTTTTLPTTSTTTTTRPTTTSTTLPTTSTMTTTRPTTTSTVTTTLSTTTSTTAKLVTTPAKTTFTTTSPTLATTTSVANLITTTSTTTTDRTTTMTLPTTPAVIAAKPTHSNSKNVNNKINTANPSKAGPLPTTPKLAISSHHAKPKTPLPKLQSITIGKASKTQVSSHATPHVVVDDSASLQNINKDLHGAENKILENIVNPDSQSGDRSGLVAALVFGVSFFVVVLFLVSRRALEAMRRRHYSRLDYLINGMYIET